MKYRTVECPKTETYYVDKLMNSEHAYHKYNEVLQRDKDDKRWIPDNVKDLIMRFITEQDIIKPYRLRIELSKLFDENRIHVLPTKVQIQNHISYLKKKAGINILFLLRKCKYFFFKVYLLKAIQLK